MYDTVELVAKKKAEIRLMTKEQLLNGNQREGHQRIEMDSIQDLELLEATI